MEFFRHQAPHFSGSVVSIGNFDGVHRGHRRMLTQLVDHGRRLGLPSVVMTFAPSPQAYFGQQSPRLSNFRDKWEMLAAIGIDYLWCRRFDAALAHQSATDFIARDLIQCLQVRHVVVGHDCRFGYKREGNTALLSQYAQEGNYTLESIPAEMEAGEPVSSTAIRSALAAADFEQAARLLGRPYSVQGRVSVGARRGTQLGFPTANLRCRGEPALRGIFVVRLQNAAGHWYHGVANLGRRPTVEIAGHYCLEVHLLGVNLDLYGQRVRVEFLKKLRDEQTFASVDELRAQIGRDAAEAQAYFQHKKADYDRV